MSTNLPQTYLRTKVLHGPILSCIFEKLHNTYIGFSHKQLHCIVNGVYTQQQKKRKKIVTFKLIENNIC